ncbi:hypothetical protein L1275_002162 [Flavobacterium sp. HSC-61S13]|nr:hypothetical protein [Flavobacterium sp. HSC-61S13]
MLCILIYILRTPSLFSKNGIFHSSTKAIQLYTVAVRRIHKKPFVQFAQRVPKRNLKSSNNFLGMSVKNPLY